MSLIKINSTDKATQGDYVLIEEEHFDADSHELYSVVKKETAKERKVRIALEQSKLN